MKQRLFEILEPAPDGNWVSKSVDLMIMILILLNVIAVILESLPSWEQYSTSFQVFETFSIFIFTVEYLLRIWCCNLIKRYEHPVAGRLKFALTPMALIDLLTILPYYLFMLVPYDMRTFRLLRMLRLLRLLKLGRYINSLRVLGNVLFVKKEELLITVFFGTLLLILSSTFMYFLENQYQPQAFSSIPAAMWWGVATLTTVGYGDIYPVTAVGKTLGAIIAVLGVGMFALPAGILASGFAEEIEKLKIKKTAACPHCGKEVPI